MKIQWERETQKTNTVVHFVKKDDAFSNRLKLHRELYEFEAKEGQVAVDLEGESIHYYIGLGMSDEINVFTLKKALETGFSKVKNHVEMAVDLDVDFVIERAKAVSLVSHLLGLSRYKFDYFKAEKESKTLETLFVMGFEEKDKEPFEEGILTSEATNVTKYLVDMPANVMTPLRLGKEVSDIGEKNGFEVLLKDRTEIEEMGMKAFLAVSSASSHAPCFIIMHYCHPDMEGSKKVGLVGKGLCYDSGGLSIKPTSSMVDMKSDMAGAAAVIGTMAALAKAKAKVNVVSVVAACENLISGTGYRPGDIVKSKGGKTIYVGNTDAEGRLTLIDAMSYILDEEKVDMVVDIATLTGAAIHCTGKAASPCISNNDEFFAQLEQVGELMGERYFRMPIYPEYKEQIKHSVADLTNIAGSPGTVTAGLFVGAYVEDTTPWIHIDIAGTSMKSGTGNNAISMATGVSASALYHLVKKVSE